MRQQKSDDPLACMRDLIEAAAKEAIRINPQLAQQPKPLSDEEWEQRVREEEQMFQELDALFMGKPNLSVSDQIIEDRGE